MNIIGNSRLNGKISTKRLHYKEPNELTKAKLCIFSQSRSKGRIFWVYRMMRVAKLEVFGILDNAGGPIQLINFRKYPLDNLIVHLIPKTYIYMIVAKLESNEMSNNKFNSFRNQI